MKLSKLFESEDLNNAIKMLRQGKACYVYRDCEYELVLSIWTDIPETITEQQLAQLLNMCDFRPEDLEMGVKHIPVTIARAVKDKTRILSILNNNRSYNKSIQLRINSFKDWAQRIKRESEMFYSSDFED